MNANNSHSNNNICDNGIAMVMTTTALTRNTVPAAEFYASQEIILGPACKQCAKASRLCQPLSPGSIRLHSVITADVRK